MAQQIIQVAGRAGRASKPGQVIIQTHMAEHPLLLELVEHDYARFAERELAARQQAGLPPYSFTALLRAEANDLAQTDAFRSEEHTSELQSRPQLVCRLLLEKNK